MGVKQLGATQYSIEATFNTRAAFSGEVLSTQMVLPAVTAGAAELLMVAKPPSSSGPRQLRFEGLDLLLVADLDMMVWRD
jgi:hypothetical protein